jgi:hypothetical protein
MNVNSDVIVAMGNLPSTMRGHRMVSCGPHGCFLAFGTTLMNSIDSAVKLTPAKSISKVVTGTEQRLDALCDLIDEELRAGNIDEAEVDRYARRITSEVDRAMAEEIQWVDASGFID